MRAVAVAGITGALFGVAVAACESHRDRERRAWRRRYDRHLARAHAAPLVSREAMRRSRLTGVVPPAPAWRTFAAAA